MCYRIESKPVGEKAKKREEEKRSKEKEKGKTCTSCWRIKSSRGDGSNIHEKKELSNFHSLRLRE